MLISCISLNIYATHLFWPVIKIQTDHLFNFSKDYTRVCDIQIWVSAKPSQIHTIQSFQSISLHLISSAPWYIFNYSLHNDLKIDSVDKLATKHHVWGGSVAGCFPLSVFF